MELFYTIYIFIVGLMIGSFLNVLIYRLPRELNIVMRSKCESCGKLIRWYQNIPVLAWLVLRGRCEKCSARISWRHPFVELIVGIAAVLLFPKQVNSISIAYFAFYFTVLGALLVHFMIDIDHKILPDSINIYLAVLFLVYSLVHYHWQHYVIGGLLGFGITYGITYAFYKLRGQIGLGGGDIKLYGALGILLGPMGIVMNIFLSCFLGSIVGGTLIATKKMSKETPIPFGPFIIIVAFMQIYFPVYMEQLSRLLFGV